MYELSRFIAGLSDATAARSEIAAAVRRTLRRVRLLGIFI
jgi:hypothetical protein